MDEVEYRNGCATRNRPSFALDDSHWSCFTGHKGEVLSLDVLGPQENGSAVMGASMLASGGEDSTCRIWDVAAGRAIRCYTGMFDDNQGISAVAFLDKDRLFAATKTSIYELDLRAPGIVVKNAVGSLPGIADDMINQISVQARRGSKKLAVADDSGKITLLDASFRPPKPIRTFQFPGGEDFCTCVAFRPRVQWDLACGFHSTSTLGLWDSSRGQRGCRAISVEAGWLSAAGAKDADADDPTTAPSAVSSCQLFNPPYINGLSFSADGRFVAVAKGNGEVGMYDFVEGSMVALLEGGHSTSVAGVSFLHVQGADLPGKGASGVRGRSGRYGPFILASVGNDRVLNLWECPLLPASGNDDPRGIITPARVLKRFAGLPGKPNWMVNAVRPCQEAREAGVVCFQIFVATTSAHIAVLNTCLVKQE